MITKIYNKNKVRGLVAGVSYLLLLSSSPFLLSGCSDYSDYNSVPSAGDLPSASQTLWENISSDPQLTKFAALAQQSKFSEALNSPRFYTVWAPVDAAFDDAEFNRLKASDSATIVKQFMHQHMTEYNYPVSAALDSLTIISLNKTKGPTFIVDGFNNITLHLKYLHKVTRT